MPGDILENDAEARVLAAYDLDRSVDFESDARSQNQRLVIVSNFKLGIKIGQFVSQFGCNDFFFRCRSGKLNLNHYLRVLAGLQKRQVVSHTCRRQSGRLGRFEFQPGGKIKLQRDVNQIGIFAVAINYAVFGFVAATQLARTLDGEQDIVGNDVFPRFFP